MPRAQFGVPAPTGREVGRGWRWGSAQGVWSSPVAWDPCAVHGCGVGTRASLRAGDPLALCPAPLQPQVPVPAADAGLAAPALCRPGWGEPRPKDSWMSLGSALDTQCSWGKLTLLQLPVLSAGQDSSANSPAIPREPQRWVPGTGGETQQWLKAGELAAPARAVQWCWVLGVIGEQGKGQGMARIWVLSCWFSSQDGQCVLERARRVQPCLWFGVC